LGGKGNLSLLVDDKIRLSNVSGFIRVSITGTVTNNSGTMSATLQVNETTLKRFNVGLQVHVCSLKQCYYLQGLQRFSINFLQLSRQDTVFTGNFILFLEYQD